MRHTAVRTLAPDTREGVGWTRIVPDIGRSLSVANKDKGGKSSKTAASKSLKEKRAAKAAKKGKKTGSA